MRTLKRHRRNNRLFYFYFINTIINEQIPYFNAYHPTHVLNEHAFHLIWNEDTKKEYFKMFKVIPKIKK